MEVLDSLASDFSLVFVVDGFAGVAVDELGDLGEFAEGGAKEGGLLDADEEGGFGLVELALAVGGEAEDVVGLGLEVEEADGGAGEGGGLGEFALGEGGAGEAEEGGGGLRVDGEGGFEGLAGFVPLSEALVDLAEKKEGVLSEFGAEFWVGEFLECFGVFFFGEVGVGLEVVESGEVGVGFCEEALLLFEFLFFFFEGEFFEFFFLFFDYFGLVESEFFDGGASFVGDFGAALDDFGDGFTDFVSVSEGFIGDGELESEAVFEGPFLVELVEEFGGLGVEASVEVGLGEVVVEFSGGFFEGDGFVLVGLVDVAEGDELIEGVL